MQRFDQAWAAHQRGEDAYHLQRQWAEARLRAFAGSTAIVAVRLDTCGEYSCAACGPIDGHILLLADALVALPLPVRGCTSRHNGASGWCMCTYCPLGEGELEREV
jgi:hypothetical protein